MRIEQLSTKPDRAGRYLVRFEGGTTMRLYRQTVGDFGLYAGLELTGEQMDALRDAAGQMSARMRAVRIVTASNVSRDDLRSRLVRKGEDPRQAEDAVRWMEELSLVDDRETAAQIARNCAAKGYGIARAKQALYEKRIPKEYWEEALEDWPDQSEKILSFLRSRLGPEPDERDRKRAMDALLRRGHSYGDIRQAMRQLDLEDPEEYDG
jgi:regulatory protein